MGIPFAFNCGLFQLNKLSQLLLYISLNSIQSLPIIFKKVVTSGICLGVDLLDMNLRSIGVNLCLGEGKG